MAKDKNARAKSIERLTNQALSKVQEGLKARGINVAEIDETPDKGNLSKIRAALRDRNITIEAIDGPSDEPTLRNLQEWQALSWALESAENPAQADNREFGVDRHAAKQPVETSSTAPKDTGKK